MRAAQPMLPLIAFRRACPRKVLSEPVQHLCMCAQAQQMARIATHTAAKAARLGKRATKSMVICCLARRVALQKQRTRCEDFEQTLRRKAQPAPMIRVTTWLARPACKQSKQTPPNGQAAAPMPALSLMPISHTCPAFASCVTTTRRHPTALKKDDCSRC